MKKKELLLIAGLIVVGLLLQYIDSGDFAFIKSCSAENRSIIDIDHPHEFPGTLTIEEPAEKLTVINPAGSIEILPSPDLRITAESIKTVYHKDGSRINKYNEMVQISKNINGRSVSIEVFSGEDEFPYNRVRTDLKIHVPEMTSLDIKNAFGNIRIQGSSAPVSVDGKFGDLFAANLEKGLSAINSFGKVRIENVKGELELEIRFSDSIIKNVETFACRSTHSSIDLEDVRSGESVRIQASHSKLNLSKIDSPLIKIKNSHDVINASQIKSNEFTIDSRHCRIYSEDIDSEEFSIKNSYTPVKLKNVKGETLNILLTHGNLDILNGGMFERIFITNSYSDIHLEIPAGSDPSLSLNTKYGSITNKTNLKIYSVKQKYIKTFSRQGTSSLININTSYGDIRLSQSRAF